jgi:hypothetical protein
MNRAPTKETVLVRIGKGGPEAYALHAFVRSGMIWLALCGLIVYRYFH